MPPERRRHTAWNGEELALSAERKSVLMTEDAQNDTRPILVTGATGRGNAIYRGYSFY
jgi:hypothetical protein